MGADQDLAGSGGGVGDFGDLEAARADQDRRFHSAAIGITRLTGFSTSRLTSPRN